ncbi:PDR/VanB family oxidoreductase [Sphingomonas arantia]|uniref:PDR/VanB family oxidoreductase n=1 Tax=Sphingomonas arantia TaxID=1460676 RepID=A0ABW4U4C5_9SPHN
MTDPILRTIVHRVTQIGAPGTAGSVRILDLRAADGADLPAFEAGAHVDLNLADGLIRQYSLLNAPVDRHRYVVAIALEGASRGGSRHLHEQVAEGDRIDVGAPRCHFHLVEDAPYSVLIAGGIGVTPIWSMAQRLIALGRSFEFHYGARSAAAAPLLAEIAAGLAGAGVALHTVFADEDDRGLDLAGIIARAPADAHFYACGPGGMLDAYLAAGASVPEGRLHYERFAATGEVATAGGFAVELARTGGRYMVEPGQTILDALKLAGINVPHSCAEGICGACEARVISGIPDHRDDVLSPAEKASNASMMVCCSGSRSATLVLDL